MFAFKEGREEKDVERKEESGEEEERGHEYGEEQKVEGGEGGADTRLPSERQEGKRERENMKVDLGWKQQIKTPFDYSICANHKAQGFLYVPSTFDWIRDAMH